MAVGNSYPAEFFCAQILVVCHFVRLSINNVIRSCLMSSRVLLNATPNKPVNYGDIYWVTIWMFTFAQILEY